MAGASIGEMRVYEARATKLVRTLSKKPSKFAELAPELREALSVLHYFGGSLQTKDAWEAWSIASAAPDEHKTSSLRLELLYSLAKADPARALPLCHSAMHVERSSYDRDKAAIAWLLAQGLACPWSAAELIPDAESPDTPRPIRHVCVLAWLDVQVDNGGFSQWFCNGFGRQWRLAIEACQAVRAPVTLRLILRGVEAFGALEGFTDDEINERVAGPQSDEISARLAELDGRFGEDEDRLMVRAAEYIVNHRQYFMLPK